MQPTIELSPFETRPRFSKDLFDASARFSKDLSFHPLKTSSAVALVGKNVHVADNRADENQQLGAGAEVSSPAEQLFAATVLAKIWTSTVSMHLDRKVRDRIFRQIDLLHDADEWVCDGDPVQLESYKSAIRTLVHHHIDSKPSLALMPSGNVIALWRDGDDKLTVEFLPGNKARWMVQSTSNAGLERATGTSPIERLREVLAPYCADRWFNAS